MVALRTTARSTTKLLNGQSNFSMCHGLTGNADILLTGSQILGESFLQGKELAQEIACHGISFLKEKGNSWLCGVTRGSTPGLMLGLSGIGYFYLRMHDPIIGIPSSPRLFANE